MAVASARQPFATVQQITPPTSSHGEGGAWNFAVPLESTKTAFPDYTPPMADDVTSAYPYSPREPLASHSNGVSKSARTNTGASQGQSQAENYSPRIANQEFDRAGSGQNEESDGIKEYYRAHAAKNTATKGRGRKKDPKKPPPAWAAAEKDDDNWIHRDKLKEIETKELEEFSLRMGRASRSNSRSQSVARSASRRRANSEMTDNVSNGEERLEQHRMVSPIPAEDEDEEPQPSGWDLRTPAEIEAEREQFAARNNHVIRPSTSRIPIAKLSATPVAPTAADRDGNGSGNWDDIAANGARMRSGSMSSQMLLDEPAADEAENVTPNVSTPTSPVTAQAPKTKGPAKTTPASRKTSAQKPAVTKSRNTSTSTRHGSGSSPAKRPGTSGGSISRPTTSHKPEGEAPWLATMYKPDPRLPPDQQIIPTHAKRLQQEKWENEGRVGSIYDKEFRLLNAEEDKPADSAPPLDLEQAQQDQTWPLPSPDKPSLDPLNTNPVSKSPTNEGGKFKLTPTIPQSPSFPPRSSSRNQDYNHQLAPPIPAPVPHHDAIRLPEPPEEKEPEKKKSCCCIVM